MPIEKMDQAMCIVLTNLKAKKLAGFESHGMVLCGETPARDQVEILSPPEGAKIGDIISIAGQERDPPAQLHPKRNPWDTVQPKLSINAEGVACWDNIPFATTSGFVSVPTIKNGIIH